MKTGLGKLGWSEETENRKKYGRFKDQFRKFDCKDQGTYNETQDVILAGEI